MGCSLGEEVEVASFVFRCMDVQTWTVQARGRYTWLKCDQASVLCWFRGIAIAYPAKLLASKTSRLRFITLHPPSLYLVSAQKDMGHFESTLQVMHPTVVGISAALV